MNALFSSPPHILAQHFSLLLQRCITKHRSPKLCRQIHALILTKGIDMDYTSLGSRLIGAYAGSGDLASSKLLFNRTPNLNVFAFNWMILALTFSGFHREAIKYLALFQESRADCNSEFCLNEYSFSAILKACLGLMDSFLGKQVHGMICKVGLETDVSVCNSLVDVYGKCGDIRGSHKVFDNMPERDVASWTTMICRYADVGEIEKAVSLFQTMRLKGTEPNDHTWTAIVAAHAKIGDCDGAHRFFLEMGSEGLIPDSATWNALITGFVQNQRALKALELFQDMLAAEIKPNEVTLAGLLPVCGIIDSVNKGKEIHGFIYRIGLDANVFIASALVDMYSKCGSIKQAWNVFNTVPSKNIASWNSMIGCFGKHGMVSSALKLFETMQEENIRPNEVTYLSLLSACSHGGLVETGLEIFKTMESYGVRANREHYSCLIDLLCRYGKMDEVYDAIKQIRDDLTDLDIGAFLNGCIIHQRRDLAEKIWKHLGMHPKEPGDFVTLSNIYALESKWTGVQDLRKVMRHGRVCKDPGFSSV